MDEQPEKSLNPVEQRIRGYTQKIDMSVCNGCDECGLRCSGDIEMSESEFEAIRRFLSLQKPEEAARVLNQRKEVEFTEGWRVRYCLFRDMEKNNCFVYPARSLVCRLFGYARWLPCPIEKVPVALDDAVEIMQAYSRLERKTFEGWMKAKGIGEGPGDRV
ncbi:MAG: YkgJ family cysteine cluster protein [Armatimonadetes bacterium]|nr:YkgJ family cysteine cluster protein [Armatimonadota bacterium]